MSVAPHTFRLIQHLLTIGPPSTATLLPPFLESRVKFNHACQYVGTATPANHADYVARKLRPSGSTNYSPIVIEAGRFFFKKKGGLFGTPIGAKVDRSPVLMLILTDGGIDSRDEDKTVREIKALADQPIFFHFVGVGGQKGQFPSIARLANQLTNVGEVYLPRFDMPDEEIYEQLISDKLVEWIKRFA